MQNFGRRTVWCFLGQSHLFSLIVHPINNDDHAESMASQTDFQRIFRYPMVSRFQFQIAWGEGSFLFERFLCMSLDSNQMPHQSHFNGCPTIKDFDAFTEIWVGEVVWIYESCVNYRSFVWSICRPDGVVHISFLSSLIDGILFLYLRSILIGAGL